MNAPFKYVKLASGEELLTMYMEPDGGFFKFKHPVKISHVVDQEGDEGVRFTKWIPFTEDKIIPVSAKYVVTMANLSPKMHKIYKDIIEEESNTFEEFIPLGNENEMLN
jgi:hypothetical protein|tara:strand:- start:54 stop:380 length:327 start_codon:yes stop_codon:yes gene_type:complete